MGSVFDPPARTNPIPIQMESELKHNLIHLVRDDLDEILHRINELSVSINQKALWHTIRFAISLVDLIKEDEG